MSNGFDPASTIVRLAAVLLIVVASGCASTVIGTATDAALAVAKTPFKVGAAVVDIATDDD